MLIYCGERKVSGIRSKTIFSKSYLFSKLTVFSFDLRGLNESDCGWWLVERGGGLTFIVDIWQWRKSATLGKKGKKENKKEGKLNTLNCRKWLFILIQSFIGFMILLWSWRSGTQSQDQLRIARIYDILWKKRLK